MAFEFINHPKIPELFNAINRVIEDLRDRAGEIPRIGEALQKAITNKDSKNINQLKNLIQSDLKKILLDITNINSAFKSIEQKIGLNNQLNFNKELNSFEKSIKLMITWVSGYPDASYIKPNMIKVEAKIKEIVIFIEDKIKKQEILFHEFQKRFREAA